ncbi:hypothetical protein E2562_029360 [Oryza meyeriana var. granulata]|uniref:Uncharacterized protein n=1 Tax=Oryza meyeriana var. granulata TaxID=110450 RepID=A0A6G1C8N7_9ORYZ|nr:hypothetical protein E2562_029360 [Oryza meyeriana var. granulata]
MDVGLLTVVSWPPYPPTKPPATSLDGSHGIGATTKPVIAIGHGTAPANGHPRAVHSERLSIHPLHHAMR